MIECKKLASVFFFTNLFAYMQKKQYLCREIDKNGLK